MRVPIGLVLLFAAVITCASAGEPRNKNPKAAAPAVPANGIKTPGIQIPYASLKPEMDFEVPAPLNWVGVTDVLLVPNQAKDGLIRIDTKAKEKKLGDPIAGIKQPCEGVINAFNNLWVGSCGDGSLVRLDARTSKSTATIASGAGSARIGLAASADSIWMLTDAKGTISRIDPQQNQVVAEFRVAADCDSMLFGETALWLACPAENRVLRINPLTNLVEKSIEVSARPEILAIGEGSIWVLCAKDGKVERIDPKTNKVIKTIEIGAPAIGGSLSLGEGSAWVSSPGFPLTRIDPQTDKVVQQFYGDGAGLVQAALGSIWVAGTNGGKLLRFDPRRIAATLAE